MRCVSVALAMPCWLLVFAPWVPVVAFVPAIILMIESLPPVGRTLLRG